LSEWMYKGHIKIPNWTQLKYVPHILLYLVNQKWLMN
jgi:hypothetical protein